MCQNGLLLKGHKEMHFIVFKLKHLKVAMLIFFVMFLLTLNLNGQDALASVYFGKTVRLVPIYCVDKEEKEIALTFDASWGSDKTESLIETLNSFEIPATFFLVGMWVDNNVELTKKISSSGFEIGTHSNLHPDMTTLSEDNIKKELVYSVKKIEDAVEKKVKVFRCPYGAYNNSVLNVASELNLKTVQWDVDSLDWKNLSSSEITKRILKGTKSGSIILCHNDGLNTVEAVKEFVPILKARGFKFKTVSELIFDDNYTIDSTGKQIKK